LLQLTVNDPGRPACPHEAERGRTLPFEVEKAAPLLRGACGGISGAEVRQFLFCEKHGRPLAPDILQLTEADEDVILEFHGSLVSGARCSKGSLTRGRSSDSGTAGADTV